MNKQTIPEPAAIALKKYFEEICSLHTPTDRARALGELYFGVAPYLEEHHLPFDIAQTTKKIDAHLKEIGFVESFLDSQRKGLI